MSETMPAGTDPDALPRVTLLEAVYQDNLRLGALARRPRRCPTLRPPRRARRSHAWALLGMALIFGPALGYLGPSLFVEEGNGSLITAAAPAWFDPTPPAWKTAADRSTSSAFAPLQVDAMSLLAPDQFLGDQAGDWSDFDGLLRNDRFPLTAIFGLDVQTIVIDAGHGGKDPGAIGANGTLEKDVALDIALRLRDRLRSQGRYQILMTRDTDTTLGLNERVAFANENRADLFVSIHINAYPDVGVNTIETYYFGAPPDTASLELAELENTGSHYRMTDFKAMIAKIANTMKHQESASLAASIQYSLFDNLRKRDHGVRNFGVKTAPFVVLLGVDSPSVLAEVSCITNIEEEAKLNTPAYRERIASYLEKGVHDYLRHKQARTAGEISYESESNG
jgi:N-acetylmuramoyl-L-alanine amidase